MAELSPAALEKLLTSYIADSTLFEEYLTNPINEHEEFFPGYSCLCPIAKFLKEKYDQLGIGGFNQIEVNANFITLHQRITTLRINNPAWVRNYVNRIDRTRWGYVDRVIRPDMALFVLRTMEVYRAPIKNV